MIGLEDFRKITNSFLLKALKEKYVSVALFIFIFACNEMKLVCEN
jgi:hypothetical protein